MKINEGKIKEGTGAAIVKRSTAAGLATGYQRTSNTSISVSAVETADVAGGLSGLFLIDVFTLPIFPPSDDVEQPPLSEIVIPDPFEEMAAGYREMATKNNLIAEEFLPLALESWPKLEK
jgi:hypothetical protein